MATSTRMSDSFEDALAAVPQPQPESIQEEGSLWTKSKVEVDHLGRVIRGGMTDPQREAWELDTFVKAFIGGYGSGKTNWLCKRAIAAALQNAPAAVAVVSPSYRVAKETTILTISEMLQGKRSLLGKDFWWRYNATDIKFQIKYHGREGRIIILSGEDPEKLKGPNLGAAYIDEPFIQDEAVYNQMIARVRHPAAELHEICLAGTPEQLNWGYKLCARQMEEMTDVATIHASTLSNVTVGQQYVERLRRSMSEKAAKAYIEGQFVNLSEGQVYYGFDPETNLAQLGVPEDVELGVGMDFNVNPMAAVVFWKRGDHMHVFDEIELPNADTEYMCSVLREKYGHRLQKVYPDASGNQRRTSAPQGRSDHWYLERAGFKLYHESKNPAIRDRQNAVNGKLNPVDGQPTLTIEPTCYKLIEYLTVHSHEMKRKQEHMTHLLDAFGYPVAYLFPVDRRTIKTMRLMGF